MIDIDELERLAKAALWTGDWHNAGCNTVECKYPDDSLHFAGEFDEIAHPVPLGIADYIAAAQPKATLELCAELRALRTRLEIQPHSIDGIAARDETIRGLEAEIGRLKEALKTPLMTRIYRNAWHSNGFEGLIDTRVIEEAFMDGAEKVLVYYGEARIFTTLAEFMEAHPKPAATHHCQKCNARVPAGTYCKGIDCPLNPASKEPK